MVSARQQKRIAAGVTESSISDYRAASAEDVLHKREVRWKLEYMKLAKELGLDMEDLT